MRRRELIAAGAAATIAGLMRPPLARSAPKALRVGTVLVNPRTASFWMAFDRRLRALGYVEGDNLSTEFVDLGGDAGRAPEGMKEVVRRGVDIVVASGPELVLKSALQATDSLPIVMVAVDYDPLALGYVASLARPGGHVTGIFFQQIELAAKRVELMRQAFPRMRAATVFWDRLSADQWHAVEALNGTEGVELVGIELQGPPYDYEAAYARSPARARGFLIATTSSTLYFDRENLAKFAATHRMASMFAFRGWVDAGGLVCYGPSLDELYRRAAEYVDRIAKGAAVSELPVEQPTKFELVINLKTAKALGLEMPPSLLARADEVIE